MVKVEDVDDHSLGSDKMNKHSVASAVVASMISIIYGYDMGVMSGAMIFIKEDLMINDTQVSVLVGILNICAVMGSLAAGRTSDYIGRRCTICLAAVIFFTGSVLMGYAPSFAILITGRCIAGLGVGFALMIAPIYSAEVSPPKRRGVLTSLTDLCISIGILIGYVLNYLFGKLTLKVGWRLMLGIAAIPSFTLAVGIFKMPESPRWLVLKGRIQDARKVLLQVSNTPREAEQLLHEIMLATGIELVHNSNDDLVHVSAQDKVEHGAWKELLVHPKQPIRRILLAAIGIHFFEHATGIEAVTLYSPRIFKMVGIQHKSKLLLATIGIGVTKVTSNVAATFFVDRVGRRKLLFISVSGMFLALTILGLVLTIMSRELTWAIILCIGSTYLYVGFFAIGLSPITWVYSSEIFPLKLRAQGAGIGVAVNRLTNAVVSMTFIPMYKAITIGGSFFFFAGMSVLALMFFNFFCPETKGVSLEDVELLFTKCGKERTIDNIELTSVSS